MNPPQKAPAGPQQLLPAAVARRHLHNRQVTFRGYLREDRLWDIEAELHDSKTYPMLLDIPTADSTNKGASHGAHPAGEPVHGMALRVTLDDEMVIQDIAVAMPHTPYGECSAAGIALKKMIGQQIGRGWKRKIEENIGGTQSCTHLRELLFSLATAAYQTITPWKVQLRREAAVASGLAASDGERTPPSYVGQCLAWDFNGPVVARIYPQFVAWPEKQKANNP